MSKLEPRKLQRMRYRQGQMLRSQDFRDLTLNDAHLRWWHNRALHRPYGIATGFEVNDHGDFVRVGDGVAYDLHGRALILTEERQIPYPDQEISEALVLLVRYVEPAGMCGRPEPAPECWPAQATRLEGLKFVWRLERETTVRDGVPIARLPVLTKAAVADVLTEPFLLRTASFSVSPEVGGFVFEGVMSERERDDLLTRSGDPQFRAAIKQLYRQSQLDHRRRTARALSRPRVASGTTIPYATTWTVWDLPGPSVGRMRFGFQVKIDTSAVGFTTVPCTFAWLQGRVRLLYQRLLEERGLLVELDSHVAEVAPEGFVFRLIITVHASQHVHRVERTLALSLRASQRQVNGVERILASTLRRAGLYVSWLGVESAQSSNWSE
jgi:hypothetical protein